MKVLIPTVKSRNSFFDELTSLSSHKFYHKSLNEDIFEYDLILIHWPEQLFGWKEPTDDQIDFLKLKLKIWAKHVKIVYVVHNLRPHKKNSTRFERLYDLILSKIASGKPRAMNPRKPKSLNP